MILDRILKGFWGRYALYLSAFMALYFLMREKLDSIIFSLWDSWITVGEHPHISLYLFCLLSLYPIYRMLKDDKNKPVIDAAHLAYLFIPISVWYLIQLVWQTDKYYYLKDNDAFCIVLWFTVSYSTVLIILWVIRPKVDHNVSSLLVMDEPIEDKDKDKLGFKLYAESISKNIHDIVGNKQAFVFGIEGCWGSGKTSFINLVKRNLANYPSIRSLDFNPWMCSNVQQMTADFFSLMAVNTSVLRLKMKFREYGKALASADGTGIVGKIVENISPSQNLGAMLESINECITSEDIRFVVFIDDTDRLDKEELLSVFKLVRNTASFSNTIFVLTYDRNYVDSVLKTYFEDEHIAKKFPDKIINFQFKLPSPLNDYYNKLKDEIKNVSFTEDASEEIKSLFDSYRKVKRVKNSLAFESKFEYFEKIPIIDFIVFVYLADYKGEEYEMIKNAYMKYTYNHSTNIEISYSFKNLSTSQYILKLIEKNCNIIDPSVETNNTNMKELTETYNNFKSKYFCIYFLLDREGTSPFIKYLEFLFRFNSLYYEEYKNAISEYGVDGFKKCPISEFNPTDGWKYLENLISIRKNFKPTFYYDASLEIGNRFINELNKKNINITQCLEYIVASALNSQQNYYIKSASESLLYHLGINNLKKDNLFTIFKELEKTESSIKYYNNFKTNIRYDVVTAFYSQLLFIIIDNNITTKEKNTKKTIQQNTIKHLKRGIQKFKHGELNYYNVRYAFYNCIYDIKNNRISLMKKAYVLFREFVHRYPDGFFLYSIDYINSIPKEPIVKFDSFIPLIFNRDINKFKDFCETARHKLKVPESNLALDIIEKYSDVFFNHETNQQITITQEEYDKLFYLENGEIKRKIFIPDPEDIKGHV